MHSYEIVSGVMYGRDELTGVEASVPLREVAVAMSNHGGPTFTEDELQVFDALGSTGWKFGRRLKKAFKKVKKVVKTVARVAKKVVDNKIFKAVMAAASVVVPPPAGTAIMAVNAGIIAAQKIAGAVKGPAKKLIGKAVGLVANKRVSGKQVAALAKKAKVPEKTLKQMALALQAQRAAKAGDIKAQHILKIGKVAREGTPAEAAKMKAALLRLGAKRADRATGKSAAKTSTRALPASTSRARSSSSSSSKTVPVQVARTHRNRTFRAKSGKQYQVIVAPVVAA